MKYALISCAKNEEAYVGNMLDSVVAQTIRPWVHIVVDDGSRDNTSQIIQRYVSQHDWIHLFARKHDDARGFGSKVTAFNTAFAQIETESIDFIGCLDADITLPVSYYEQVLLKMSSQPRLGVASGVCLNKHASGWSQCMSNSHHVPGALQLFRIECYNAIGGYQKVTVAGVDSLAELKARMLGWETASFSDIKAFHHKPIGSATGGSLLTCFRRGMTDYLLGKHPLYVSLKSVRRMASSPYIIGAFTHLLGYFFLMLRQDPLDVSRDVRDYARTEELRAITNAALFRKRPY